MYPYMCKITLHLPPIYLKILCVTNYVSRLKFSRLLKATLSNAIRNLMCASHFLFFTHDHYLLVTSEIQTVNLLCKFGGWCSLVRFPFRNIVHHE